MWRLFPFLKWFWVAGVTSSILGVAIGLLFDPFRDEARAGFESYWSSISLALLSIGALTLGSWLSRRRKEQREETQKQWAASEYERQERADREKFLRRQFALFKAAAELQPEDFGFEVLVPRQPANLQKRPFYSLYIPRKAIPHPSVAEGTSSFEYSEDILVQRLRQGRGLILIGQPLDGKSRTLFELVRHLVGYQAVRPFKDRPLPADEAFGIMRGHPVVLLVEDLNDYADSVLDLREFFAKVSHYTDRCVVAATCRDGPELAVVGRKVATGLARFYEDIPLKLNLLPPTEEQKMLLAQSIGKSGSSQQVVSFPTLGSITMEDPLTAMRQRFEVLPFDQRDILRALQLLTRASVLPFSHKRLLGTLQHVFHRTLHLGDSLDILAEHAFLRRPARQDPINPEPAYMLRVVPYIEGKTPEDDFAALADALAEQEDDMGLVYLGNTYGMPPLNDEEQAMTCFERALSIDSCNRPALYNKAALLAQIDRYPDALRLLQQLIALYPDFPEAYYTLGLVLARLKDHPASLEAIEKAIYFRPHDPLLWAYKGGLLVTLQRYREALEAYDQVLHLQPDFPRTWGFKGIILARLGRRLEALQWLCHAWRARNQLRTDDASLIADTLRALGSHPDECEGQPLESHSINPP